MNRAIDKTATAVSEGHYRVIERLATGGMAEVFLAEALGLADFSKPVAIKRVLPHLAENAKFIGMFLDEARLSAKLNHRNIAQVFDVGHVPAVELPIARHSVDGLDEYPSGRARFEMRREMDTRVHACELRFGHHRRHARVYVTYDGATGRASDVSIIGTYFSGIPVGDCIVESVRNVVAPPFASEHWNTDYVFMIH